MDRSPESLAQWRRPWFGGSSSCGRARPWSRGDTSRADGRSRSFDVAVTLWENIQSIRERHPRREHSSEMERTLTITVRIPPKLKFSRTGRSTTTEIIKFGKTNLTRYQVSSSRLTDNGDRSFAKTETELRSHSVKDEKYQEELQDKNDKKNHGRRKDKRRKDRLKLKLT